MLRPGSWLLVPFVLALVIILVNTLLIIVIRKTPSLHTVSNMYITSLAVVDLIVGVCVFADATVFVPYIQEHFFDRYHRICLLMIGVSMSSILMSILHLMVISVDRCVCIKWPFFYLHHVNRNWAMATTACIWLFGIIYTAVPHTHIKTGNYSDICNVTEVMPLGYVLYFNGLLYFVSLLITVIMYVLILRTASQHRKCINRLTPHRQREESPIEEAQPTNSPLGVGEEFEAERGPSKLSLTKLSTNMNDLSSPNEIERPSSSQMQTAVLDPYPQSHLRDFNTFSKNIKFFAIVFGVYFVLITPASIVMALDYNMAVNPLLYDILVLLALSNSGANFFIFYSLNAGFRIALRKALKWRERIPIL